MNILILGSGGREHAFAQKIAESDHCTRLFIAPGNAGTASCGQNIDIAVNDFDGIKAFCLAEAIGLVIVGPEDPLVAGIYDFFASHSALRHIYVVGPSAKGARLEGSKSFSKRFMHRHNIPTAAYEEFTEETFSDGLAYLKNHSLPIVLKADGLAAGKGVVICNSADEACKVFTEMIKNRQFGEASSKVVVEQFLDGIEVSVFVLTNGRDYKIIGHAKDYKRIGEKDTGLNTGGMGCVSPVPFADHAFLAKVEQNIIQPTVNGINQEGIIYNGFIFFGLINVKGTPHVIEYNCRMGDPETEVVLPRLKNDLVALLLSLFNGSLKEQDIITDSRPCCTVVAVSGGYPGNYAKNFPVSGLDQELPAGSIIFHAGTKLLGGQTLTNGGRVLAVTSFGDTLANAVNQSNQVLSCLHFDGMYFRKDIGYEFIKA